MKKLLIVGLLAVSSCVAAAPGVADTLKRVVADPQGAGLTCTSMSYGVSCRGKVASLSTDRVSVQRASRTRYIIEIGSPTFTLAQVAPRRTPSSRPGYERVTGGPLAGHFVRKLGDTLVIRSAGALEGLY